MPRRLSTAQQALKVLAYLMSHPEGVVAQEVARLLGKSLTTAHALLNSLVEEGFAERTERGYRVKLFPQHDKADLAKAFPGPLTPKTPYTLTDPLALEEELARVRESGLAVEMEEYALGLSGLAAPLFDAQGRFWERLAWPSLAGAFPLPLPG